DLKTVKRWGVAEPYALVQVEVNSGFGSPAGESFVATHMRVLDGTREYPLHVAEVIERVHKDYESWLQGQKSIIDAGMREAQRVALGERGATGPRETDDLMYATWLPETQQLRIQFRTRVRDGAYEYASVPRSAALVRDEFHKPKEDKVRFGTAFGVELGMAYEVSRLGDLAERQAVPLQTFQK